MRGERCAVALALLFAVLLLWRGHSMRAPATFAAYAAPASAARTVPPPVGTHRFCCRHTGTALPGTAAIISPAACLPACTPPAARAAVPHGSRVAAIWHVGPLELPPDARSLAAVY
jgi:hypothetical protein